MKTRRLWSVNIEPYVSAVFKAEPGSKPVTARARAPFLCQHPAAQGSTTRKKPTPYNNRFVVVHGYITDVVFKEGSSELIERFKVTVDNVEFLGAEPASGITIANKLDGKFMAHSSPSFFGCLLTNSPQRRLVARHVERDSQDSVNESPCQQPRHPRVQVQANGHV